VKQQHRPNAVRDAVMIAVVIVGVLCVFGMAMRTSEPKPPEETVNLSEPIDDYPTRFGKSMKAWGERASDKLCEEEK